MDYQSQLGRLSLDIQRHCTRLDRRRKHGFFAAREDFLKLKQIQIFIEHLKLKPKQIQTGPLSEL
jgi:hypothetical protein